MERKFYQAWVAMRYRCKNDKYYIRKNILVCERWSNFDYFFTDLWDKYLVHYKIHGIDTQLDRINNKKGYSNTNCRWVTQKQNTNNRDNRHTFKGKTLTEWSEILGIKRSTLAQRYFVYNWTVEKTLSY
jgi:hypothetical protein